MNHEKATPHKKQTASAKNRAQGKTVTKILSSADADIQMLKKKHVAVIGYGNQGRAQALNLQDSGITVTVGLRAKSPSKKLAIADGMIVKTIPDAVSSCNLLLLLTPDEVMGDLFKEEIAPHLNPQTTLGFSHGFSVHYKLISPLPAGDVIMVSPKGTGEALRSHYLAGTGLPSYLAVAQDTSGNALATALAWAEAIGCTKQGAFLTSFKEETESDLFTEQAVLCGALGTLIKLSFEVLVEAGYDPHLAYFECLTEAKLVCDLLVKDGFTTFSQKISNTAELGGYLASPKILGTDTKDRMRALLKEIQHGDFAHIFMNDYRAGFPQLKKLRAAALNHPIDAVRDRICAHRG